MILRKENLMKEEKKIRTRSGRMTIARFRRYKFCMLMVMETVCVRSEEKNRNFLHYAFSSGFGFSFAFFFFPSPLAVPSPDVYNTKHKITSAAAATAHIVKFTIAKYRSTG